MIRSSILKWIFIMMKNLTSLWYDPAYPNDFYNDTKFEFLWYNKED